MKTKKHTVTKVIWGCVYGILGLSLAFMILWNVGLAFKWEWCHELVKIFNTDVRQTQYFAATSLLLQVMLILVAALLVIFLVVNDNKARRIEKMKRRLKKSNASYETTQE